jgi:hypothetical protein
MIYQSHYASKGNESNMLKKYLTPKFIVALITVAKNGIKVFLLVSEWINKMWYTYTVEYYSDLKKKEIVSFEAT